MVCRATARCSVWSVNDLIEKAKYSMFLAAWYFVTVRMHQWAFILHSCRLSMWSMMIVKMIWRWCIVGLLSVRQSITMCKTCIATFSKHALPVNKCTLHTVAVKRIANSRQRAMVKSVAMLIWLALKKFDQSRGNKIEHFIRFFCKL